MEDACYVDGGKYYIIALKGDCDAEGTGMIDYWFYSMACGILKGL